MLKAQLAVKPMPSYLVFQQYGTSDSGRTKRVEVRSANGGDLLALIAWHAPWRRYVAQFQGAPIFDSACLMELSDHLTAMNDAHRLQARQLARARHMADGA